MGDNEPRKKIKDDPRWKFVQKFCGMTLNAKGEKWTNFILNDEVREIFYSFFTDPDVPSLIIMSNDKGNLTASNTFPDTTVGKTCYFTKLSRNPLTENNLRDELSYGDMSDRPIEDLNTFVNNIMLPIVNNQMNTADWPTATQYSVNTQIQELRNSMVEVKGNMANRTLLPLPITIETVIDIAAGIGAGRLELCDKKLSSTLEDIVIKWSDQVKTVVDRNSREIFEDAHPTPINVIDYWTRRRENLDNLYGQLRDTKIRTIVYVLERIDSPYTHAFNSMFKNLVEAFNETLDITLYLEPMRKHFERFESVDFSDCKMLIRPLLHVVCLMWAQSNYFATISYMSDLFEMINNMLIMSSSKCLDASTMFQRDVVEVYDTLTIHIHILKYFKEQYEHFQELLPEYEQPGTTPAYWSLDISISFKRYEIYIQRLVKLQEIFYKVNEFEKVKFMEFPGIRGKDVKRSVMKIYAEYQNNFFKRWNDIKYDALELDPNLKFFEKDSTKFMDDITCMERELASQFNLALDECHTLTHTTKLMKCLTTLLQQPIIYGVISQRFPSIIKAVNDELDAIKLAFRVFEECDGTNLNMIPIDPRLPRVSGTIAWILKLRGRLDDMTNGFKLLKYPIFASDEGEYALQREEMMRTQLNNAVNLIYNKWAKTVSAQVEFHLKKPLYIRVTDLNLLHMNYDDVLAIALKDTKNLNHLKMPNIPTLWYFQRADYFRKNHVCLLDTEEWYNDIKASTDPPEMSLIMAELEGIDESLVPALTEIQWDNIDDTYTQDIYVRVSNLHERVSWALRNKEDILNYIENWAGNPMYYRKNNENHTLLNVDEWINVLTVTLQNCQKTQDLIGHAMNLNYRLFFNYRVDPEMANVVEGITRFVDEPTDLRTVREDVLVGAYYTPATKALHKSEQVLLYHAYEKYMDVLIAKELMTGIANSFRYLRNEMNDVYENNAPLFEVIFDLKDQEMVFHPDINENSSESLFQLMEKIIIDIFSPCYLIPRVSQTIKPPGSGEVYNESYIDVLDDAEDIERMKNDIILNVKATMSAAYTYYQTFVKYNYLWLTDKQQVMDEFLVYSRPLTDEEREQFKTNDAPKIRLKVPELDNFGEQILAYKRMKEEVLELEKFHDFNIWLRVDSNRFVESLAEVCNQWAALYTDYLFNKVMLGLKGLEDFIEVTMPIVKLKIGMEDYDELLKILDAAQQIDDRKYEYDFMFEPLQAIVEFLKVYEVEFDKSVLQKFVDLPNQWNALKRQGMLVRQDIEEVREYQVDLARKRISIFDGRSKLYREQFMKSPLFSIPCDNAYDLCDRVHKELSALDRQYSQLFYAANLLKLDAPYEMALAKCNEELPPLKKVWDLVRVIEASVADWSPISWTEINTAAMINKCNAFSEELKNLDDFVRNLEPYSFADNTIKSLVAITQLKNSALQERHWLELERITEVHFEMNETVLVSDLLAFNLQKHSQEIQRIEKQAMQEEALDELEENWMAVDFEFVWYERRGLYCILESDTIGAMAYADKARIKTMKDCETIVGKISEWQANLEGVNHFLIQWFTIQNKWIELEKSYMDLEEFRLQLPEETAMFEDIDATFRELLSTMVDVKKVIAITTIPELSTLLNTLTKDIFICHNAFIEIRDG